MSRINNETISVIIPVYNVEKYLERCLDSVVNQTYTDLEILLIDDGSSDASAQICDRYAKNDNRIIVVHQENTGTTMARKNALKKATGKYLAFVDSDDWLELNTYEIMHEAMVTQNVEMVSAGHYQEHMTHTLPRPLGKKGIYKQQDVGNQLICDHMFHGDSQNIKKICPYLWDKLFLREVFAPYYMAVPDDIYYIEDFAAVYRYMVDCQSCYIVDSHQYHYNIGHETSATGNIGTSEKYIINAIKLYLYLKECYQNHDMEDGKKENILKQLQIEILHLCFYTMPKELYNNLIFFPFPYQSIGEHKKIVIYGAGHVGQSYYKGLIHNPDMEVVAVIDKNKVGEPLLDTTIDSLEVLREKEFDAIVISIDNTEAVKEITEQLHQTYGVPKEKVIWRKPIYIFDVLYPY